ncbi:MAG: hypothetical protein ACW98F_20065 [Candidatus Hodarchaeales archaeon]|jgi:hypothetical protein
MSVSLGFHPIIQIITTIGFIGLVGLTWNIYSRNNFHPLVRFMGAFITIALIQVARFLLPYLEDNFLPPAHEMYETIIESFQFLAALFFAWGYYEIYKERQKQKQSS